MTLRIFQDVIPDSTVEHVEAGGNTAITALSDRNPSNNLELDNDYRISIDLGDQVTPVNCFAAFGIYGAGDNKDILVEVKPSKTDPAFGDFTAMTYSAYVRDGMTNLWIPMTDIYDDTCDFYYRYWMVDFTLGATGDYVGEIAMGVMETPAKANFAWGRERDYSMPLTEHRTIGGSRYAYQRSKVQKSLFRVSWDKGVDTQTIAQMKSWFNDSEGGLYPMVVIPDDTDRTGDGVFYAVIRSTLADIEEFKDVFNVNLEFEEVPAYEAP